jgi:hypothetical protein
VVRLVYRLLIYFFLFQGPFLTHAKHIRSQHSLLDQVSDAVTLFAGMKQHLPCPLVVSLYILFFRRQNPDKIFGLFFPCVICIYGCRRGSSSRGFSSVEGLPGIYFLKLKNEFRR